MPKGTQNISKRENTMGIFEMNEEIAVGRGSDKPKMGKTNPKFTPPAPGLPKNPGTTDPFKGVPR